jgi:hypothetical protein
MKAAQERGSLKRKMGIGVATAVAMVLLASLAAMPASAGGPMSPGHRPIASGAVQTGGDGPFQVQFVIFGNGGGVVNYAFTGGLGLIGGFEAECVYQDGNKVWALGPETHHAGQFGGEPWEGSEYNMLIIEDNADDASKSDMRDILFSAFDELDADRATAFCDDPKGQSVNYPITDTPSHTVVHGDIRIRP